MKAVNYYIIIDIIKDEPSNIGGLILTEETDVDNRYSKAKVVSTGNLVEVVKKGDIIFYDKHAGHDIGYGDDLYRVIRRRDIVLVE